MITKKPEDAGRHASNKPCINEVFFFPVYRADRKDRQSILSNNNDFIRKPFHFLYLFSVGNLLLNLARCEIQLEDPYSTWFKKGVFKLYFVGRKIEMAKNRTIV